MSALPSLAELENPDEFRARHIGPDASDEAHMLDAIGAASRAALIDAQGHPVGRVTSGTVGPTVNQPIAMGYVAANHAVPGGELFAEVRGRRLPMRVAPMPFAPHRYRR